MRTMALTSKPLTAKTWPAFARLVEKHNGIFGGCWCISFHLEPGEKRHGAEAYRAMKKALVREGRAHAALVFDGPNAVGWCQFGPTSELPNIRSKKAYDEGLRKLPDWRFTCFSSTENVGGKALPLSPSKKRFETSLNSAADWSRPIRRTIRGRGPLVHSYAAGPWACLRRRGSGRCAGLRCVGGSYHGGFPPARTSY